MKQILSACLEQVNRFDSQAEYAAFLEFLEKKQVKYKILSVEDCTDGTVIVELKKQYNGYDIGAFLD